MRRIRHSATLLITAILALRWSLQQISAAATLEPGVSISQLFARSEGRDRSDSESLLASGVLLPLQAADLYSLELLPGISDRMAHEILAVRDAILRQARGLPCETRYRALELAHGIGEKRALSLSHHLQLTGGSVCPPLLDSALPASSINARRRAAADSQRKPRAKSVPQPRNTSAARSRRS